MKYNQHRNEILARIKPLTGAGLKMFIWLDLSAQYSDGTIILNRKRMCSELELSKTRTDHLIIDLVNTGYITRLKRRNHYQLKFSFIRAVRFEKKPLFSNDEEDI